ncbi:lymphocyte function-associated antigen 3 isoform X2 [Sorex araneus]|uniref:lymphocyte function-associated antigen 3 isoform X2 n=1 Tax=Sorex araneus TaxID=42254 RepID=UPI00243340DB|nr:lymphocyte function-associated antigen 3 isoform X2 [Sorex araneus]
MLEGTEGATGSPSRSPGDAPVQRVGGGGTRERAGRSREFLSGHARTAPGQHPRAPRPLLAMAAGCPPPWLLRVLIALLLARAAYSVSSESIYGAVNQTVTFHISNSSPLTEILWTKEKDKVVEWYHGSDPRVFPPFTGRIHLNTTSGDLNILSLSSSDEGVYEFDNTKKKFSLSVFEPLPSPEINLISINSSIIVKCSIPKSYQSHLEDIKVSWNCSVPKCANSSTFEIQFGETDHRPQKICCIVSNPLFWANSSFSLPVTISAPYSRDRWRPVLSLAVVAVVAVGIYTCVRNTRSPGNVHQTSESLPEPKPACDKREGNTDQASELLQELKPAHDKQEDE